MAITGPTWSTLLYTSLSAQGMTGTYLLQFCNAIGTANALSVVGVPFTTQDTGMVPGIGVGTGVGVVGLNASVVSNQIYTQCVSAFGQAGARLKDFTDAIANALVSTMATATLTSSHAPVFVGAGSIVVGSIGVSPTVWRANIIAQGVGIFMGSYWPNFAEAIANGQAQSIIDNGSGSVTITGTYTGPVPGSPSPGVGTGSGTIT